jgi:hypothetical protein
MVAGGSDDTPDLRSVDAGRAGCATVAASPHGATVDTIRCDTCETERDTFVRGWRAYVVDFDDAVTLVFVACPDCAELYGEDEVPLAGGSRSE